LLRLNDLAEKDWGGGATGKSAFRPDVEAVWTRQEIHAACQTAPLADFRGFSWLMAEAPAALL
jgi:hypothetical protein